MALPSLFSFLADERKIPGSSKLWILVPSGIGGTLAVELGSSIDGGLVLSDMMRRKKVRNWLRDLSARGKNGGSGRDGGNTERKRTLEVVERGGEEVAKVCAGGKWGGRCRSREKG